jgi:transposase
LENNKHINVTRDRAGAYASAISQVIPDAIQVADRFHLFNNLMHAVKHAINSQLPEKQSYLC